MVILTNIRSNTAVVLVSGGALVALAVAFSIFITKGQPARKQASLALQAALLVVIGAAVVLTIGWLAPTNSPKPLKNAAAEAHSDAPAKTSAPMSNAKPIRSALDPELPFSVGTLKGETATGYITLQIESKGCGTPLVIPLEVPANSDFALELLIDDRSSRDFNVKVEVTRSTAGEAILGASSSSARLDGTTKIGESSPSALTLTPLGTAPAGCSSEPVIVLLKGQVYLGPS
jgi:hypothetical protein